MDKATVNSLNSQIVIVGDFNPAIITPDWLSSKGLIGEEDLQICRESIQQVAKSKVMVFESKWFRLQAFANQLSVATLDGATPRIADLAASILALLPETPVQAFGLNFDANFKIIKLDDYHKFGDYLVPKAPYLNLLPKVDGKDAYAGLVHLTIAIDSNTRTVEGKVHGLKSQKRITVEPSNGVEQGIFFLYNDHIVVSEIDKEFYEIDSEINTPALVASNIIRLKWEKDLSESQSVFQGLLNGALS